MDHSRTTSLHSPNIFSHDWEAMDDTIHFPERDKLTLFGASNAPSFSPASESDTSTERSNKLEEGTPAYVHKQIWHSVGLRDLKAAFRTLQDVIREHEEMNDIFEGTPPIEWRDKWKGAGGSLQINI